MKCCYYPDRDAVNLCSKCGKGLCMECVCGSPPGLPGGFIRVSRGGYFGENLPVCLYSSACSLQVSFSGCRPYTFGNRISTMFSALAVRNIMLGVPSGCFTGSFWYGGIQCTVFHFLQTFLLSGHTLPYLPE